MHTLLKLTRPLFCVDTETTGIDTSIDRIVELGFQEFAAEGLVKEWRSFINPGMPIPASVTRVHGIDNARMICCNECGQDNERCRCTRFKPVPAFSQIAPSLAKGFSGCDFAGKNVRFDLRIIAAEMRRAGVEWSYSRARIVDAERMEQLAVPRHLSDLHEKYTGKKHDGAHGALSDARAAATVIVKQLEAHPTLPRDLDELHKLSWRGWLDEEGKFKMIDGVATCCFGKWRGKAMRDIPVDYFDWLLRSDFPADVKALAEAAKLGSFPEER